jgi:hypothetical protein
MGVALRCASLVNTLAFGFSKTFAATSRTDAEGGGLLKG